MSTTQSGTPIAAPDLLANLDLQIEYLPPSSLAAFGRKSRTHSKTQIAMIRQAIQTFGFDVPVLVDADKKVLAGNARVEAAIQEGMPLVPTVELAHLTPAQKRAFVIAENRLSELSGWDKEVLRIEFEELGALDLDFSLEVTGFLEPEIDAIVFGDDTDGPGHKVLPLPSVPVSRVGDLWLLGDQKLLCGDSTSAASLETLLGNEQVRAVFTDAPYNVRIAGHVTGGGKFDEFVMASGEMSDAEFTEFLANSLEQIAARLMPGGVAYFCMDWRHISNVLDAVKVTDLEHINLVVWDKQLGGMGSWYRSRHELIFVFRKPGAAHLNRVQLGKHGRDRHNVWCYPGVNGFGSDKAREREMHPTCKPLTLVRDAILDCSGKGDLVLDLFSGSGTTIMAAQAAGRRGAAIDLDPRYVDTGVIRWQDHTGQEARLAATGQTFCEVRGQRAARASSELAPLEPPETALTSKTSRPPARTRPSA